MSRSSEFLIKIDQIFLIKLGTAIIGALIFIGAIFLFPSLAYFRFVILVPVLFLVIVIWIAFRFELSISNKIFAVLDMLYYSIIVLVVGMVGYSLPLLDEYFRFNTNSIYENALGNIASANKAVLDTKSISDFAQSNLENYNEAEVNDCVERRNSIYENQLPNSFKEMDDTITSFEAPPGYIPQGCEGHLAALEATIHAGAKARRAKQKANGLQEIIDSGNEPAISTKSFFSEARLGHIYFQVIPTLMLIGVMFKIGKSMFVIRNLFCVKPDNDHQRSR